MGNCTRVAEMAVVDIKETLKRIEGMLANVKLPFTGTANIPFYVQLEKPRPSMSKHDSKRPDYWDMDDGYYILACANYMPEILAHIKDLEEQLESAIEDVDGG